MSADVATILRGRRKNAWRKPWFLSVLTWSYVLWSILPVVIAIAFSFNAGRSRTSWQGFSLRWWIGSPAAAESLWYNPEFRTALMQSLRLAVLTMLVAVPLGVLFAIGMDRWRGRVPSAAGFTMLLSFIVPEIILAIALFLAFTFLLHGFVRLGTTAQVLGLSTLQIPYPYIVVRARLLTIGKDYEEAAMDLGSPPTQAIRRVLLPLLSPAIFAGGVLVFANSIDDFVTVRYLSGLASTEPLSVKVYNAARGGPVPTVNAAVSVMLFASLAVAGLAYLVYRSLSRMREPAGADAIGGLGSAAGLEL
jgi:spermidine/putrescine transport system permease protein